MSRTPEELLNCSAKPIKDYVFLAGSNTTKIKWNEVEKDTHVLIDETEYKNLYNYLQENGYKVVLKRNSQTNGVSSAAPWYENPKKINFSYDKGKYGYHYLYVCTLERNLVVYKYKSQSEKNRNTKDKEKMSGTLAFKILQKMFKERTNKTFQAAFGLMRDDIAVRREHKLAFNKMLMNWPMYINRNFVKMNLNHVYKADLSSAYGYQLTKTLPDYKSVVEYCDYVEPTPEYPFAFYPDSHHIKIYGELDTRDIANSQLYIDCRISDKLSETPKTIFRDCPTRTFLMKASDYTLKEEIQTLFDGRAANPVNKKIMNFSVGQMRSEDNTREYMGHIAAIVYARHWKLMSDLYQEVLDGGNIPLQVQTDAIIWLGKPIASAKQEKSLGGFHSEYEDCKFRQKATGIYAFEDKDGNLFGIKHQGLSAQYVNVNKIEDIDNIFIVKSWISDEGELHEEIYN